MVRSVSKHAPPWSNQADIANGTAGRASLEFLLAGIVLFIPVVLLAVSLWQVQHASFATDAAARHAARVFTQATSIAQATSKTEVAVQEALRAFGMTRDYRIDVECRPRGGCVDPGSWVQVTITAQLDLGTIPVIPAEFPVSIPISGVAHAQVSDYRGDP